MTQRQLFVSATFITLALWVFLMVGRVALPVEAAAKSPTFTPRQNQSPTPTATPSVSPSTSPSVTPSSAASPSPSVSPSPLFSPSGAAVGVIETRWSKANKDLTPTVMETLSTKLEDDRSCWIGDEKKAHANPLIVSTNSFAGVSGATVTKPKGRIEAGGANGQLISSVFTSQNGQASEWQTLRIFPERNNSANITKFEAFARVTDAAGTIDPNDAGWVKLNNPLATNCNTIKFDINKIGRNFQYRIHLLGGANIEDVAFVAQPGGIVLSPSPSAPPSIATTISPSPTASNEGSITIITKQLVTKPTVAETPHALLPSLPATPSPTISARTNPDCFSDENTSPAANVALAFHQLNGGKVRVEDQKTDENGTWSGLNGNQDNFPAGTYAMTFGDYDKTNYQLVDICVNPTDGAHVLKTQTTASGKRATIIVTPGVETKVVLLYAPRANPYVAMSMFAINSQSQVMRVVYPGVSFSYLLRYENTGGTEAVNLTISDVLPEQYYVPGSDSQTIEATEQVKVNIDALGRTTISKKIGNIKPGQKGSLTLPVTLRADAFGSTNDIQAMIEANKAASGPASSTTAGQSRQPTNLQLR